MKSIHISYYVVLYYIILYFIEYLYIKCDFAFVWTAVILLINYYINALQIPEHCPPEPPQSRAHQSQSLHTVATCAPEPITAELTATPHLKKQADLYLQRWAGPRFGSVPFCSVYLNWLLWINETTRVRAESVGVWGDPETRGQQSGIGICGCSCVASC